MNWGHGQAHYSEGQTRWFKCCNLSLYFSWWSNVTQQRTSCYWCLVSSLLLWREKVKNSFFFPSLSKAILRTAELPSSCNVIFFYSSTFCSSFRHGRIYVYLFRLSYKFSSILSTVDLSKHLVMAWVIWKFIQLISFVTFSVFFGNQVWLDLYEHALLQNELKKRLL